MPPALSRQDGRATLRRSGHRTSVPGPHAPVPAHAARPFARPVLHSECRAARAQVNRSFASSHFSRHLIRYNKLERCCRPAFGSDSSKRTSHVLRALGITLVIILRVPRFEGPPMFLMSNGFSWDNVSSSEVSEWPMLFRVRSQVSRK